MRDNESPSRWVEAQVPRRVGGLFQAHSLPSLYGLSHPFFPHPLCLISRCLIPHYSFKQKTFIPFWDERCVRGATQVKLLFDRSFDLTKKPVGDATGSRASLTHFRYSRSETGEYPCPVTGAFRRRLLLWVSPCNSEVHSAPSFRAGLSPSACSLYRRTAPTRPLQSLFIIDCSDYIENASGCQ